VRRLDAAFATTSALFQGGVKPPHSKALRAFSWFLGAANGMSDCHENGDPLTRPTTADENAVADHPLPQGGEGRFSIFMHSGEPKHHEVFTQDRLRFLRMTVARVFPQPDIGTASF
jgi:hypothetical protein